MHRAVRNRLKPTIVAFLLSLSVALHAEPFDWRPANFHIAQLLKEGRLEDASTLIDATARRCADATNSLEAGLCSAILRENRSEVLERRGDLVGAEADLRTMIAERSRVLPASDKLMVEAWLYLVNFMRRNNRAADEEVALAKAEQLALADPAQAQDAQLLMQARANVLFKLDRPIESINLFRNAIAFARATPGIVPSPALELGLANVLNASEDTDAVVELTSDMLAASRAPSLDPVSRLRVGALLGMDVTAPEQARAALKLLRAAAAVETAAPVDAVVQLNFLSGWANAAIIAGDPAQGLSLAEQAKGLAERSNNFSGRRLVQLSQLQADALERLGRRDDALALVANAQSLLAPTDMAARADMAVVLAVHLERAGREAAAKTALAGAAENALRAPASRDKAYALVRIGAEFDHLSVASLAQPACGEAVRLDDSGFPLGPVWLTRALLCLANSQTDAAPAAAHAATLRAASVLRTSAVKPPLDLQRAIQTALLVSARNDGHLPEALEHAQSVLALSRQMRDPARIAEAWSYLASVQRRMGRYEAALASADEGLSAAAGSAIEARAALLNGRGLAELYQRRPADALATLEEALALRRDLRPEKPALVAEGEGNVAAALADLGRTEEAARHLDDALAIFRRSDTAPASATVDALVRRARLAEQLGDLVGQERTLREALAAALRIDSSKTAAISFALAAALDRRGEFTEASSLRTAALTRFSGRFGTDSREVATLRLDEAAALRSHGRLHDASEAIAGCEARLGNQNPLLLPCLSEEASILLTEGEPARAGALADRAIQEAETGNNGDQGTALVVPLLLRARAAAGVGDAVLVSASLDRIGTTLQHDPGALDRLALTRSALLAQAGDPTGAEAALRRVEASNDLAVRVGASGLRTSGLIASGKPDQAEAAWNALLPRLDSAPRLQLSALEGLGRVASARWRFAAAAAWFEKARTISVRLDGAFNPQARDLAIAQAEALARAGDLGGASAALAPLDADYNPLTAFLREDALASATSDAGDRASALIHSREALRRAKVAFGDDGQIVAYARLRLAVAQTLSGEHLPSGDVDRALAALADRKVSWSVSYMIERMRGVVASATGRPPLAEAAFERAEALAAENAGPDSVLAALARANRGSAKLDGGDARGADALLRQALAMASPQNEPHGPVWASIAMAAARAARRLGDTARATRLELEASRLIPFRRAESRQYWL